MNSAPLIPGKPKPFDRELAPAGTHRAVCHSVHDLGFQSEFIKGKKTVLHKVVVIWEIDKAIKAGKFAGQPFVVSKKYTFSLHEKSNLRKDLAGWRGRDFTEQELEKFDLRALVGKQCLLNVVHSVSKSGNGTYANVYTVSAVPEGMPPLAQTLPPDHDFKWITELQAKAEPAPEPVSDAEAPQTGPISDSEVPF